MSRHELKAFEDHGLQLIAGHAAVPRPDRARRGGRFGCAVHPMNTPTRSFRIAAIGLDVLHQTRLKLASSMLLAERMEVVLQPWPGNACDLLVIGTDHADAARALSEAHAANVPTLSIARRHADPAPGACRTAPPCATSTNSCPACCRPRPAWTDPPTVCRC